MKIYQVDSFTEKAFAGNPTGVCILPYVMEDKWMQNVAAEMNLAETAFLLRQENGFNLRWFAPRVEVDLCGHATLASAHILWETGCLGKNNTARFFTKSGELRAKYENGWIQLDFPREDEHRVEAPHGLIKALGVDVKYVGRNRFDYIVEVDSEETVRNMEPNFEELSRISTRGVIVTSLSKSEEYDFVSRFFCPAIGINEDPVTGSAHCCLGPYWMKRLNKEEFTAFQTSKRGGMLKVKVAGDRVLLSGKAVTVIDGELLG